jgi:hypothetical protein
MAGLMDSSRVPLPVIPNDPTGEAARLAPADVFGQGPFGVPLPMWWELFAWRRIVFTMQPQQQSQWCWAAVSVSVAGFYTSWSRWTQCMMVNAEFGHTDCCINGASAQCNQPNVLDSPLQRAGVFDHMVGGDVGIGVIKAEIDAGRPLCWRIGWAGGGGHFAVIEGYRLLPQQWVAVDDPIFGQSDLPLTTLTGGAYQGTGDWTHSYYTRRPPFFFPALGTAQQQLAGQAVGGGR